MTVRTKTELLALFADNTTGDISAQDLRDFVDSAMNLSCAPPALYFATNRWIIPGWGWEIPISDVLAVGKLYYLPIAVDNETSFDQIGIYVQTPKPGALLRLGCYAWLNGQPSALVFDAGTVNASTNGIKVLPIAQTLAAGMYFLACVDNVASVSIRTILLSQAFIAPVSPWAVTPGDDANVVILTRSGQTSVVAGGLPDPAPAPDAYDAYPLPAISLRLVN